MEPTGTNGRWRHNIPTILVVGSASFLCWIVDDIEHCPWSRFDSDRLIASRPLAGSRTATGSNPLCGWNECRNGFGSVPSSRICGGHSPGETPGPIPNPVAKARRGDGTALERVWESSAPPHPNFVWVPRSSRMAPGGFVFFLGFCSFLFRVFRPDPPAWAHGVFRICQASPRSVLARNGDVGFHRPDPRELSAASPASG